MEQEEELSSKNTWGGQWIFKVGDTCGILKAIGVAHNLQNSPHCSCRLIGLEFS